MYLLTYLFFWFFLIEISLVIMRYYKHTFYYLANHSFINLCIVVGMGVNNIVFLRKLDNWKNY